MPLAARAPAAGRRRAGRGARGAGAACAAAVAAWAAVGAPGAGAFFGGPAPARQPAPPPPLTRELVAGGPPAGYDTESRVLPVLRYPHPALRRENAPVTKFDERLKQLAVNLVETLKQERGGVGLAAPQVGVNLRVMVYVVRAPGGKRRVRLLVNPRIVGRSESSDTEVEECLSFPGLEGPVSRPVWVEVEAQSLSGATAEMRLEGFDARLFLHEYDHLDGVVYVDRLGEAARARVQPALDALARAYEAAGGRGAAL